jgi:signal transduction histidine kinase
MFDILQPWAIGLAAVLDTALLAVLLERRNRPFARLPIVILLLGSWLFHVGALFSLIVAPWPLAKAFFPPCVVVMAAGLLIKPCALLHASLRLWRSGLDLNPHPTPWYALAYLPVAGALAVALQTGFPSGPTLIEPLLRWALPFVLVSSAIHVFTALTIVRVRPRIAMAGARPFFLLFATLLLAQSALNIGAIAYAAVAGPEWNRELWFVCGLPSVAITGLFAYFLLRHNLFRLATERAVVYGAFLAAAAMLHQLAFQQATLAFPESYGPTLIFAEGVIVAVLLAVCRPLRERASEAVRYLMGVRVDGVRERLRDMAMRLSLQASRPANEILSWFAAELQGALDVEFVAGWLFRASGEIRVRFGDTTRTQEESITALARQMATRGHVVSYPPYLIGQAGADSLHAAGVSVVVRKVHQSMEGLLVVGRHARGRDLSDEEANTVVLLVEQLAVALENSLLLADRLAAERRASQLEKLSALGLMASAIAHEVKNPLSAIKTIATVLAEDLGAASPHAEDLTMIRGEIDRLATTVQQLLEFARPAVAPARDGLVRVERVVSSIAQIMRRLAQQRAIAIETRFDLDLPTVRADETSLREIFFNLVSNSLDAAGEGGCVTLVCTRLNGHIIAEVRDSGTGLAPDVRERIFEPFVTTKSVGTGLGLYVVKRRVHELGGDISCEDGPHGTTFIVRIPTS